MSENPSPAPEDASRLEALRVLCEQEARELVPRIQASSLLPPPFPTVAAPVAATSIEELSGYLAENFLALDKQAVPGTSLHAYAYGLLRGAMMLSEVGKLTSSPVEVLVCVSAWARDTQTKLVARSLKITPDIASQECDASEVGAEELKDLLRRIPAPTAQGSICAALFLLRVSSDALVKPLTNAGFQMHTVATMDPPVPAPLPARPSIEA